MNRIQNHLYKITLGGLVFLLAACAPAQVATPTATLVTPTATPLEEVSTPVPSPTATAPLMDMESLVEQAKNDLSERLSIPEAEISLVEAREVVWPDSSLGCPQPGMQYSQVLEDGALILLQAGENRYEYHVGGSRGLFLCENAGAGAYPLPPVPQTLPQTPVVGTSYP